MLNNLPWKSVLALLLAAFFIVGGLGNIFASETIRADYLRWGYPSWFHYITGVLEIAAAALIAMRSARLWGATLACLVMAGAAGTVLLHGEFTHAIAPLMVLAVALTVLFVTWGTQRPK
ncbi:MULTISPECIES: DoxX family protein [Rhodobacterales]|nr:MULTISPECIES: DoxX family protein [Rhodobacterales]UOA30250.1 hypothetical protein DSM107133_05014 [Pseudosulfitobacter sp. DSM 107133]|tara:strand:- start:881 stop:1237 length:357 start_codon:yes stop_codon:yes gene_type:complete